MAVSSTVAASTINNKPSLVEGSAGVGQHFMSSLLARTPDRQTSASPPLLKKMLMSPQTTKGMFHEKEFLEVISQYIDT